MDRSAIPLVLKELNLNEEDVSNIYHHGSWVYGTNSATADRDLLIVTRLSNQKQLEFWTDFDYFHDHKLHKLRGQYDITIYTIENFELLLEKTFLIAVQCIFLPDEFKLKDEIDFRKIYLEKYYNPLRIKQTAFYEMYRDWKKYKPENDLSANSISVEKRLSHRDYVFKQLFHGLRYLDFAEQLIRTQSIYDYKRVTYIFNEMKEIRGDPIDNSGMERLAKFVLMKSSEFKSRLDTLVPTNIIKGTFEAHITLACTEQVIHKLKIACENTKYQVNSYTSEVTITSTYHGEYPLIVKQIEEEIYQHFQDFNIRRIKIESLVFNEGIPHTYIDKKLFWNRTNYFKFCYTAQSEKDRKGEKFQKLINIYRSKYKLNADLSHNDSIYTLSLFNVGREKAFQIDNGIVEYSIKNNFPLSNIKQTFIVYDTCTEI